jgi:hypothetical protein
MKARDVFEGLRNLPKPHLPAFFHPRKNYRTHILNRVSLVLVNRLDVIRCDWEDDIDDARPDQKIFETKHRARTREVNAILQALAREFPDVEIPSGDHPFNIRSDVRAISQPQTNVTTLRGSGK